jgi:hypothetical protein
MNSVVIPPECVDPPYDASPFVPGQHYIRLLLSEVRCFPRSKSEAHDYAFFSSAQFSYGDGQVGIPTFLNLSGTGVTDQHPQRVTNKALTPLFPYRGGGLKFMGGVVRATLDNAESDLLEQLSALLSSHRFSLLLDLVEVLRKGIQRVQRRGELHLGTFTILEAPGYFAVLASPKPGPFFRGSIQPLTPEGLRVVNGSLLFAETDGFSNTSALPEDVVYLLFRVERVTQRPDWSSLANIEEAWTQAMDAARQETGELVRDAFKRVLSEVWRSRDLSDPDKQRMIEKIIDVSKGNANPGEPWSSGLHLNGSPAIDDSKSIVADLQTELKKEKQLEYVAKQVAAAAPFPEDSDGMVLTIECKPRAPVRVEIGPKVVECDTRLRLDVSALARAADEAFCGDWQFKAKNVGDQLLDALNKDPLVWTSYAEASKDVEDKRLHLRFRSELDFLRAPFEFLPSRRGRERLVLRHPLARSVMGDGVPIPRRRPVSRGFLNHLYRRKESLSVLLVASNTPPDVPRVDHEVKALSSELPRLFEVNKIGIRVKTLSSQNATYDAVLTELKSGNYHILHYAGHGAFDEKNPEDSYLPLRETHDANSGVKQLKVPQLRFALEESKVSFVYLSCCVGATQADPTKLQDDDFLGITDGLLQAGIPSILAYRWPVVDSGGEKLAIAFYKYLSQEGDLDTALLLARRDVSDDRDDRSWLSPMLILQD